MPSVTYIQADGSESTCEVGVGVSVLDGALDNGIGGFIGQCGGAATCGTCHCYIEPPWRARLPPAAGNEADLLPFLDDVLPGSRLACQIRVDDTLDGLEVHLPAKQI